jgi:hypothetical protein
MLKNSESIIQKNELLNQVVLFGSMYDGSKKLLFSKLNIDNLRVLKDSELTKLKESDSKSFDVTKIIRSFKLDQINNGSSSYGIKVIGNLNYGAYKIIVPKDHNTDNLELNKLLNYIKINHDLEIIIPRFGLIDFRTNNGKDIVAVPIKIYKIKQKIVLNFLGPFELKI